MISKQSHSEDSEDSRSRIRLIADKRKFLEGRSAQVYLSQNSYFSMFHACIYIDKLHLIYIYFFVFFINIKICMLYILVSYICKAYDISIV